MSKALSVTASRATSPVSERLCKSHLLLTGYDYKQKFTAMIFPNASYARTEKNNTSQIK